MVPLPVITVGHNGLALALNKISKMQEATFTLVYDNESYTLEENTFNYVLEQWIKYETYVMTHSKTKAEQLLEDTANSAIDKHVQTTYDTAMAPVLNDLSAVSTKASDILSSIESMSGHIHTTCERSARLSDNLTESINNLDTDSINTKLSAKLDNLNDVKTEVLNNVKPVLSHLETVIKELNKLVKLD